MNTARAARIPYVSAILLFCAAIGCFDGIESVRASPPVGSDVWVLVDKPSCGRNHSNSSGGTATWRCAYSRNVLSESNLKCQYKDSRTAQPAAVLFTLYPLSRS